jgi:hypothetical protein
MAGGGEEHFELAEGVAHGALYIDKTGIIYTK